MGNAVPVGTVRELLRCVRGGRYILRGLWSRGPRWIHNDVALLAGRIEIGHVVLTLIAEEGSASLRFDDLKLRWQSVQSEDILNLVEIGE